MTAHSVTDELCDRPQGSYCWHTTVTLRAFRMLACVEAKTSTSCVSHRSGRVFLQEQRADTRGPCELSTKIPYWYFTLTLALCRWKLPRPGRTQSLLSCEDAASVAHCRLFTTDPAHTRPKDGPVANIHLALDAAVERNMAQQTIHYNADLRAPVSTATGAAPKARVHAVEWARLMDGLPLEINPSTGQGFRCMSVDEWSARWKRR